MERPQLAEPNQSDPRLHQTLHETHWNESQEHLLPEKKIISNSCKLNITEKYH